MTRKDIIQAIILFVVIAFTLGGLGYLQNRVDTVQRSITCISAEANIEQLEALTEIADRLGIPHDFTVPEVPEECGE